MGSLPEEHGERLRQAQEVALRRSAEEQGRFDDLLFFYAVRRESAKLQQAAEQALSVSPGHGIVAGLLNKREEISALVRRAADLPGLTDPWIFYTLAKGSLAQNDIKTALTAATVLLQRGVRDTTVLNLIARRLLSQGAWDTACGVIERSLSIAPGQRDLLHWQRAAKTRKWNAPPLYLDLLPKHERVAVYLPVYNVAAFIRQTIEAILRQSYPLAEFLIIDDASLDNSMEIANGYPVRAITHPENRGLAAVRNRAFQEADTAFVFSMDTDATPEAGYLKQAMMEFENAPVDIAGVGGRLLELYTRTPADQWRTVHLSQDNGNARRYMDTPPPDGAPLTPDEEEAYRKAPLLLYGSNTVFRRKAVLAVGGYEAKYRTNAEDSDLCDRLRAAGYHYAFSPHAIAWHHRRDTLESVLRTDWNWGFWLYHRHDYYAGARTLAELLRWRIGLACRRIAEDFQLTLRNAAFISFASIFGHLALDLRHMISQNRIALKEALSIQREAFDALRRLDDLRRGCLFARMRAELARLLLPDSGEALPEDAGASETFTGALHDLDTAFESLSETQYAALCNYPHNPDSAPDLYPLPPPSDLQ